MCHAVWFRNPSAVSTRAYLHARNGWRKDDRLECIVYASGTVVSCPAYFSPPHAKNRLGTRLVALLVSQATPFACETSLMVLHGSQSHGASPCEELDNTCTSWSDPVSWSQTLSSLCRVSPRLLPWLFLPQHLPLGVLTQGKSLRYFCCFREEWQALVKKAWLRG